MSNKDKANVLADHYHLVNHLAENMGNKDTEQHLNPKYRQILGENVNKEQVNLVAPCEIRKVSMRTGSRNTPGLDGIQNIVIKNLP